MKKVYATCFISALLQLFFIQGADAMPKVKYIASFKTQNAICYALANGAVGFSSAVTDSGTMSTGDDFSPMLQNGINELSILMTPTGKNNWTFNFTDLASCSFELRAMTEEEDLLLTSLKAEASAETPFSAKKSFAYDGTDLTSAVTAGKSSEYPVYEAKRTVTLKGLPEWTWTRATPFTPTPENMQKLYDAYMKVWMAMDKKDLGKVRELMKIDLEEEGAHNDMSPEEFFNTYSFRRAFKKYKEGQPVIFSKYSLKTYANGKLVQLKDKYGKSPLMLQNSDDPNSAVYTYSPFFSLVDGEVLLTR